MTDRATNWQAAAYGDSVWQVLDGRPVTPAICELRGKNATVEIARMIAAAPEMMAALEFIIDIKGSTGGAEQLVKAFKYAAKTALAKAAGGL